MSSSQLHPLRVNPGTGEPFLRLPSPLEDIIITPPRVTDAPSIVAILNDPTVCQWLKGPPYPYLPSHADSWLNDAKRESDATLLELKQTCREDSDGTLKLVGSCPVRSLRAVQEDGTDVYIGNVDFRRCAFLEEDPAVRGRLSEENTQRVVGDPAIVWCLGDYLAPSHHGRGIMTAAVGTLLASWAIPRMGVRRMRVEIFRGNNGSVRVFEKNGFVLEKTLDQEKVTNYGNTIYGHNILWWEHS
ncbi:hypothetical protein SCP_0105410 [Sparassis crispa]|uniref:N-acetyltransferase domain-containing protein n=1 Tax=Sparassis crispa TaxID=139825 RepID=A0A401G667_9APHY|nr:hypothetical protein SCP_0105410 [Sparassis crispa]GBE77660.1 hypothetical protein SCP_0105410 [Sparassis crispa]